MDHEASSKNGIVFANELALDGIKDAGHPFPVGSIFVREKWVKPTDKRPSLLAVMIKRDRGFNSNSGDWQFLTANAELTKLKSHQKSTDCIGCHLTQRDTDFVYPLTLSSSR